ncbi:MAG: tetratricopeptide repeat protein, partial [Bacteroidota bacterium]
MKRLKIIFMLVLTAFSISLTAQKQQFKKADKQYKAQNYAQAIPHYEAGLAIKTNLSAKTKLANCYRMINQMEKAERLYAQIVRQPKAKTNTYFYYAETLMSNEKYDEAKYWFEQYHKFHPEKEKGRLMAEACDRVKDIIPYFPLAEILPFPQNSEGDDTAPVFFNGGIVFSSDRKMGAKLLKQKSGTTGRDFINIYYSKENENFEFSKPKKYSGKLNELNKNTANFSYKADSTLAVFSRNSKVTNRKNAFTMQLYQAESSNGKRWKNVRAISFCRVAYNYMHPALSPDGQWLFFVSDKPSGNGGTDLYVSKRKKDGSWSRPQNLGPNINTSNNEGFP